MADEQITPFRFSNLKQYSRQQVALQAGVLRYLPEALPPDIFHSKFKLLRLNPGLIFRRDREKEKKDWGTRTIWVRSSWRAQDDLNFKFYFTEYAFDNAG